VADLNDTDPALNGVAGGFGVFNSVVLGNAC